MIKMSKRALLRERNEAVINYNEIRKAADEVNMIVDAILAEVVRAFGTDGTVTINAPKTGRKKLIDAEKTDDGKLVLRLRSVKDETERSDTEG